MKSVKVKILVLLISTAILLGPNPIFASEVETPEFQETAHLYYNSKEYGYKWFFFYKEYYNGKNVVQYKEQFDEENQIRKITIIGRTTQEAEIAIFLTFNEKEKTESSRLILKTKTEEEEKEVKFQGIMTGIQYLRNHQLIIGKEKKVKVISDGETYWLLIKVKQKKRMVIDNIECVVYLTEVILEDKYGHKVLPKAELWVIKGGKLDGYIARFKILVGFAKWLELTLNKASKI